jgi:hypothetical protein
MTKTCGKCREKLNVKHFTKRGKSKKTGKPIYSSYCNLCREKNYGKNKKTNSEKIDIDPKWLIRGTISKESENGFTQFTQE